MNLQRTLLLASALSAHLVAHADAAFWQAAAELSRLEFIATQAGAKFTGAFADYTAAIRFDPDELNGSRFDVTIATRSVDTADAERDDIIRGPDLFAVERFPQARYVAERFAATAEGYVAHGELMLRGQTRAVPVHFTFEHDGTRARLRGHARFQRLAFGVGQGEWQDTQWVGNDVEVRFDLRLEPAATD